MIIFILIILFLILGLNKYENFENMNVKSFFDTNILSDEGVKRCPYKLKEKKKKDKIKDKEKNKKCNFKLIRSFKTYDEPNYIVKNYLKRKKNKELSLDLFKKDIFGFLENEYIDKEYY